jgi:hypothetical protein
LIDEAYNIIRNISVDHPVIKVEPSIVPKRSLSETLHILNLDQIVMKTSHYTSQQQQHHLLGKGQIHIVLIMNDYESRRLENIKRNRALITELGIPRSNTTTTATKSSAEPAAKRRKVDRAPTAPSRISARIASAPAKPVYNDDDDSKAHPRSRTPKGKPSKHVVRGTVKEEEDTPPQPSHHDIDKLKKQWTSWIPAETQPARDPSTHCYIFPSQSTFTPNLSPADIIRQGAFGGTYFRPYYSKVLGITIEDDWKDLPSEWTEGIDVEEFMTSTTYNPEVNKFKVKCGQSIEEWEAAGWIRHEHDVRGWFQWYCRFFQGRRCEDDERQIGRWSRCVGERGRFRMGLLKSFGRAGVRSVMDEGEDEGQEEERRDVSAVVSQTCWHWAWEVRQGDLDKWWSGK